ncbi:single-stranded DNA-binding protein [Metabacillus fastidiosus]|uniref:Single-stranded DNA-binding protein n=1 Tax=Metabacillus fastidiosus TaxID=1458 RepID=A0ABU6NT32_9BACI|nr:single-stranded DNA-binding protein [Metabacillus fastidiosus]MED4400302.1 single-stranded DNA-binding protein [Metabacillus fastidiosus]
MLIRLFLVGRLTRDPEHHYTPSGAAVTTFTLAVNRTLTHQQGADFINCVVWCRQAKKAANFFKKGNLARVDGRLKSRSYEDQTGKKVYITELVAESVQFLEPKGSSDDNYSNNSNNFDQNNSNQNSFGSDDNKRDQERTNYEDDPFAIDGNPIDISDDDLPF